MQKPQEKITNNELERDTKPVENLKTWKTPELKTLPVPTRTQGNPNTGPTTENTIGTYAPTS